jgi:hypothetical protein
MPAHSLLSQKHFASLGGSQVTEKHCEIRSHFSLKTSDSITKIPRSIAVLLKTACAIDLKTSPKI